MKVKLLAVWCSVICIWPSIYAQGMTDDPLTTTLKSSVIRKFNLSEFRGLLGLDNRFNQMAIPCNWCTISR